LRAISFDEIHIGKSQKFLMLVYQIDAGCTRLLWVGQPCAEQVEQQIPVRALHRRSTSCRGRQQDASIGALLTPHRINAVLTLSVAAMVQSLAAQPVALNRLFAA
jgi:hypothetical protein